jgi:hypothetical protein
MPAIAGMQATVLKLATSNSKDDSISLTAYNSTNARTAGMKVSTGQPTQYRDARKS